ncbi:hypothetical protein G6F40_015935 [Rhizopus arrhizus]|nr:hypothetical protein G6F40_015935 [Rhizopus arrhizus]
MTIANQSGQAATAMFVEDVIGEISRTKPVRSHFTFTQGMQADAAVGALAAAHATAFRRLQLIGEAYRAARRNQTRRQLRRAGGGR